MNKIITVRAKPEGAVLFEVSPYSKMLGGSVIYATDGYVWTCTSRTTRSLCSDLASLLKSTGPDTVVERREEIALDRLLVNTLDQNGCLTTYVQDMKTGDQSVLSVAYLPSDTKENLRRVTGGFALETGRILRRAAAVTAAVIGLSLASVHLIDKDLFHGHASPVTTSPAAEAEVPSAAAQDSSEATEELTYPAPAVAPQFDLGSLTRKIEEKTTQTSDAETLSEPEPHSEVEFEIMSPAEVAAIEPIEAYDDFEISWEQALKEMAEIQETEAEGINFKDPDLMKKVSPPGGGDIGSLEDMSDFGFTP